MTALETVTPAERAFLSEVALFSVPANSTDEAGTVSLLSKRRVKVLRARPTRAWWILVNQMMKLWVH